MWVNMLTRRGGAACLLYDNNTTNDLSHVKSVTAISLINTGDFPVQCEEGP
jgi:hypothetical protein